MKDQKLTLYNVEWQALRISFLSNWVSLEGTCRNIDKLRDYLREGSRSKYWRAINLLNAVRMGYSGQGLWESAQSEKVLSFRKELQKESLKFVHEDFVVDSEDKIKKDWSLLTENIKKEILKNLKQRLKLHESSKHRDELRWFLGLIDLENT